MLLDEPFGALDPLTRDRLRESFDRIRNEIGLTCAFVTHDIVEALTLGDRIAVMKGGKAVQVGTPDQLLDATATEHPYVAELTPDAGYPKLDHFPGILPNLKKRTLGITLQAHP